MIDYLSGMVPEALVVTEDDKKAAQVEQERYAKQALYKEQYDSYLMEAKERIKAEHSALMEENIRIEIRNWLNSCFKQTGKIPELPSAESGGSRIIFSRQVFFSRIPIIIESTMYKHFFRTLTVL